MERIEEGPRQTTTFSEYFGDNSVSGKIYRACVEAANSRGYQPSRNHKQTMLSDLSLEVKSATRTPAKVQSKSATRSIMAKNRRMNRN
jgi:hypothetical protein